MHTSWFFQVSKTLVLHLKDPLLVSVGPIIRARSKMIKEPLSGLVQEIWVGSKMGHSKLGPKEDEGIINLIQAIDGVDLT
jgi:hypothetical protein